MKIVQNEDMLIAAIIERAVEDYQDLYPCSIKELTHDQTKVYNLIHKKDPELTAFEVLEVMNKLDERRKAKGKVVDPSKDLYAFEPTIGFRRVYEFFKIREWILQDWIYSAMDVEYTGKDVLSIVDARAKKKWEEKHGMARTLQASKKGA